MIVKKKYEQHRRDCWVDLECESCGYKETVKSAYDDRNYWDNVIPSRICKECKESSNSLGTEKERISTKHSDVETV